MNWLRKIGNWLWLNKERMVLAVMVCVLIFRVYQVLNPKDGGPDERLVTGPDNEAPENVVSVPPLLPPEPPLEDWSSIWRRPPFPYRPPRTGGAAPGAEDTSSQTLLTLEDLRSAGDGSWRAKIRTASRAAWYEQGEQFEQFTLMSIDPESRCVEIFSEQEAKTVPKCIE